MILILYIYFKLKIIRKLKLNYIIKILNIFKPQVNEDIKKIHV